MDFGATWFVDDIPVVMEIGEQAEVALAVIDEMAA